jgi:hypothetical protein
MVEKVKNPRKPATGTRRKTVAKKVPVVQKSALLVNESPMPVIFVDEDMPVGDRASKYRGVYDHWKVGQMYPFTKEEAATLSSRLYLVRKKGYQFLTRTQADGSVKVWRKA